MVMAIVSRNNDSLNNPVQEILGPGGVLSGHLPGYEGRPAQITMAQQVMKTLQTDAKLVVEAGTGTGKTLAYLVPAVLSEAKVIISTGTKTLQEQIFNRDIPLLLDALGLDVPVACMKGISNYLCLRRLAEFRRTAQLVPDADLDRLLQWAEATRSGDRAEMADLPDDGPYWHALSPTPETRIGPRCDFFEDCFITRMRRQGSAAQIVVINHYLLMADLVLKSAFPEAAVLPTYEVLVLDEAHQLESIATSFFGHSASSGMFARLARDARKAGQIHQDEAITRLATRVEENAEELFYLLARQGPLARRSRPPRRGKEHMFRTNRIRLVEPPFCGFLEQIYFTLDAALEAFSEHLERGAQEDLINLANRAQSLRNCLTLFAEMPEQGVILWAEQQARGLRLHASPVEVGPLLRESLLETPAAMIFTSATLATGNSHPLAFFRERVGLQGPELDPQTEELVLPSPFDFARQALLYIPRDLPLPNHRDFIGQAAARMIQLMDITGGRCLGLFTSHRNLREAKKLLADRLDYPLLVQGDQPRSVLLDRFRREVSSVLLATASFWEGVDVVGESLSMVIIDKLPFAVPDDPLTAARIERLQRLGQQPFVDYQVPLAALGLKQGFGRLIRHRTDRGLVAILDRRLKERGYGRTMLRSLPPCPITSDLETARQFFVDSPNALPTD